MTSTLENLVIGIDLGGTTMSAGLIDANLQIIESAEEKTVTSSQEALLDSIGAIVGRLMARATKPVAGVGFGIPSMIDQARGRAVMSVNVPLADVDFVDLMKQKTGLPVFIDNDANVAALAEARAGAARGAREVIMITLGTGIGGGIIIGGHVYRGATGSAAELGHMVIDVNGPRCQGSCPNYGCFETMASGTALKRYAAGMAQDHPHSLLGQALQAGEELDGALVTRLAREGDEDSIGVLAKIGYYVGVGMTNLINIFNPEFFIIGGGVAKAGDFILQPALDYLNQRGLRPQREEVQVKMAHFGPEAGIIGAACLVMDELEHRAQ